MLTIEMRYLGSRRRNVSFMGKEPGKGIEVRKISGDPSPKGGAQDDNHQEHGHIESIRAQRVRATRVRFSN
jgi:hypothetical protein